MSDTARHSRLPSFRRQLMAGMMAVISTITVLALYFAQRKVEADAERDLHASFKASLASLDQVQELRRAAIAERCRTLARKPRIHAALEDNALDLLYLSARDELRDVLTIGEGAQEQLHARFYRFIDSTGTIISPPPGANVGELSSSEEKHLALPELRAEQQIGYVARTTRDGATVLDEVVATPIVSTETEQVIAALVLGFKPVELSNAAHGMRSGIWLNGRLHFLQIAAPAAQTLSEEIQQALATNRAAEHATPIEIEGVPHLLFFRQLNAGSHFPPAFEVSVYPLTASIAAKARLRWQILTAGAVLLLGGLAASRVISARLSVPVEQLEVDSRHNRAERERAEAALESTSLELERAARFSSDTSHQLKTPVAVLRAGLEELLARESLGTEVREEISALVHQTFRLTSMIEDLLLLSRMDAGRLRLEFSKVDVTQLMEALLDDLSAMPEALAVEVETDIAEALSIDGEKRYTTLVLQNLLENARKYNRPGGRIRVTAREDRGFVRITIGNNGRGIPEVMREHIFERFHRGASGEDVPGHGLGLNLARELARIHGGELRLAKAEDDWTEFEVTFRAAKTASSELKVA